MVSPGSADVLSLSDMHVIFQQPFRISYDSDTSFAACSCNHGYTFYTHIWIRTFGSRVWQQCFFKMDELIVSFDLILKLQAGFCLTILSKGMVVICVDLEKSGILQSNG